MRLLLSAGGLVYPPGGSIDEKFCHAAGRNPHHLIQQPNKQIFPLFRLHQVCGFEAELLIEHHNGRSSSSYWRNAP
jgi:hypothetical protein